MGRRHLRHAWTRGDACRRVGGGTLGARSQAHRRAAPHESPARRRRCARHDCRGSGGARRGLAGVDAPRPHDLGLLHLCDPVQSRPGVSVLGLAPALAASASGAERHFPRDAGRRLYGAPPVRAEGAGRPRRRTMADDRARAAGSGDCVPGRGARQHGDRLRLSGRNLGAEHAVDRLCRQRRRARDPDRTPAGSLAPRLSAHPLGDLGLPDRPSGLSARPALSGNFAVRPIPRRRSGAGRSSRRPLPRQRDPVPVRRRGGAAEIRGQRLDPPSSRDRLRPSAQRAGPVPPQADRGDRRVHPHALLGVGRGRFRSRLPDRARTRVCDRAHEPSVRPQVHPRRTAISLPSARQSRIPTASTRSSGSW